MSKHCLVIRRFVQTCRVLHAGPAAPGTNDLPFDQYRQRKAVVGCPKLSRGLLRAERRYAGRFGLSREAQLVRDDRTRCSVRPHAHLKYAGFTADDAAILRLTRPKAVLNTGSSRLRRFGEARLRSMPVIMSCFGGEHLAV